MSNLDDLIDKYARIVHTAEPKRSQADSFSAFEVARQQLAEPNTGYHEGPEGTFHASGRTFGVGYAEACIVVDPSTGLAEVDIDGGQSVPEPFLSDTRKLFRRLNQDMRIPGLVVGDDRRVHFHAYRPCNLVDGENLHDFVSKGFSTLRGHGAILTQLFAGRSVWEIVDEQELA